MLAIKHIQNPVRHIELELPLSKSILNRMLLIEALSGTDTGLRADRAGNDCVLLSRTLQNPGTNIDFEDAGTPLRLYIAYAALKGIQAQISGTDRLAERPLKPLLLALESLGCVFKYYKQPYHLPLSVVQALDTNRNSVQIDGSLSSQFISALMLIGPYLKNGLLLQCVNDGPSLPYIHMTAALMHKYGIDASINGPEIHIKPGTYKHVAALPCEPDWSAAGFIYAWAAAAVNSTFFIRGLGLNSLQGDVATADFFSKLGVRTEESAEGIMLGFKDNESVRKSIEFKLSDNTDLFPPLVAACAYRRIPAVFYGIHALRYKESDRLAAMRENLLQCGVHIKSLDENSAVLEYGDKQPGPYHFNAFEDHRIAMACSVFAFERDIRIQGHECVKKSFPGYWEAFSALSV